MKTETKCLGCGKPFKPALRHNSYLSLSGEHVVVPPTYEIFCPTCKRACKKKNGRP
ncbi:MAG: hypothetical protein KGL39_59980 [Patescibacteria group bacterium]|nr:hypothetical protein [Patescibacteria group bacterium]